MTTCFNRKTNTPPGHVIVLDTLAAVGAATTTATAIAFVLAALSTVVDIWVGRVCVSLTLILSPRNAK